MAEQLTHVKVIRYPLSRNPAVDFRNARTGIPHNHALVPGTDLYFCLISSSPEKLRRLRTFMANVRMPDGKRFPEGGIEFLVLDQPLMVKLLE